MNSIEYTAYPYEKEILFYDGLQAVVNSIEQVDQKDDKLIIIKLFKEY